MTTLMCPLLSPPPFDQFPQCFAKVGMCNGPVPITEFLTYFPGTEPGAVPNGRVAMHLAGHGGLTLKALVFETASFP